jgi:alkanesulfonate monooxygenase SsuD/methylene tetrahydromethanopterin reductase-like flavin-dependent oxidoreductase (luciferase family)
MSVLSIGADWQGALEPGPMSLQLDRAIRFTGAPQAGPALRVQVLERINIADDVGIHSVWVPEAWGRDAFSLLIQAAEVTKRVKLATGVANIYSRSAAMLSQQFATLDEVSSGRAIVGIGIGGRGVVQQWYAASYARPVARLREYLVAIKTILAFEPFHLEGQHIQVGKGARMAMEPLRKHIPIFSAALGESAVRVVARYADGWFPTMIPIERLAANIQCYREAGKAAGRDPSSLQVKSPSAVTVVNGDPGEARQIAKRMILFNVCKMGNAYADSLSRNGYDAEVQDMRRSWDEDSPGAAIGKVSDRLLNSLGAIGSIGECRERLQEEVKCGADILSANVRTDDPIEYGHALEQLMTAL